MKKTMAKSLSVIIPACNEIDTISDVIQSVKGLNPLEIIVVANGCTDGTEEVADHQVYRATWKRRWPCSWRKTGDR
ncbi:glycosyltransferase, involved in cell wall biogenesis [Bacillus cereus SJ1]|nr:glycosyltransferase, involved in cell wall biogenesis [Bacillus cereus SJ1]